MTSTVATCSYSCPQISGYAIVEPLYTGTRTAVYRAVEQFSQRPVVIKLLNQESPTLKDLLHFRNQYTITQNLDIPGIVSPFKLEAYGSSYALIMEDFGGVSLRQYTQEHSLSLLEILAIARQLSDILHELHQSQIIHKDIKPSNILIHPETKQVKLIDFSIASLLPREAQEAQNPNVLEGTLAYLSPEQTGRMNRGIDYRSDFYNLGATLFELLTGQFPFQSSDPMELVHCHLAKLPEAPHCMNPAVPPILSEIVLKLMAKNAEDRYQSASGLKYDLDICWHQIQNTGSVEPFQIGSRDLSNRFLIPEKLYGREAEVQALLDAFERVADGHSELLLVAGFSGIGKTAVINEVHKPIARQQGYFIKGKFDQFQRNIPFFAIVQAFRDLMGQLLSESDTQIKRWKTRILEALGDNAQVMVEVIPELERIIGQQPPAPELSGTASQNRFNSLFQKFIQVFTTVEHPLVVFLDDLQWADSASLKLMQRMMGEIAPGYLLLIGAYRDNEISSAHPLMLAVDELRQAGTIVHSIRLKPLDPTTLNQLVADALHQPVTTARPLTELVYQKTEGNPFFATQFLKALHQDQQITFNTHAGHWQYDITQIQKVTLADDVVTFMVQQLQKLSASAQDVLKLAACIGNQFDLKTLAVVAERSEWDVATALWESLEIGLIIPQGDCYKLFSCEVSVDTADQADLVSAKTPPVVYRFAHDRIQQAAYKLISDEQKPLTHLTIGRLLDANTPESERDAAIFEIVNHFNIGAERITQPDQLRHLAHLNLLAGRRAKAAIAYETAVGYFTQGIQLLPADAWETDYEFSLTLHHERLEAACLNTDFDKLDTWSEEVLRSATSLLDTIKVYEIHMMALRSQGRFPEVVEMGLKILRLLGVEFPDQPTAADIGAVAEHTRQLWQGRLPLSLLDLPLMSDPSRLAAMQILTKLVPSAHIAAPNLLPLLIFKQVELSIQFGNSPISIFSYADYGLILCGVMDDPDAGYEFGQLSLSLLETLQITPFKSRAFFIVNSFIRHWKEPLHHSVPLLQEGYQSGLETGDWECVALNALTQSQYSFWSGQELNHLVEKMDAYRQTIQQVKQEATLKYYECYQQVVFNLLGQAEAPHCLQGAIFDDTQCLPDLRATNDRAGLFHVALNQGFLSYLFGHYEQATHQITLAEQYSDAGIGYFMAIVQVFYSALIYLACYPEAPSEQQPTLLEQVNALQGKLQNWANHAPFNHLHRWQLVEAERCRVLGQFTQAIEFYDHAIASAQEHHFVQDEALANELAARFYLDWGKDKIAAVYMQEAYTCYVRWGAIAKTDDLEQRYAHLLQPILQQSVSHFNPLETLTDFGFPRPVGLTPATTVSRSSSSSVNAALDFAAILKASQSLSRTIQLDELLHQLTQIILQYSGADRCALVRPSPSGEWQVTAIATLEATELHSEPLNENLPLAAKLIQYVKNTQEAVVINNLKTALPVMDDYLIQTQPKSVLCLPILNQGHLIGTLYLENRCTSEVFTRDRIVILNFLCNQAAISLENAQLYQKVQESEQLLQLVFNTLPQRVFWKDRSSRFLGCNNLFLQDAGLTELSQIVGKTDFEMVWEANAEQYRADDAAVMESEIPRINFEEPLSKEDGTALWLRTSKIPLRNAQGDVIGVFCSYEDITPLKEAEELLKQQKQDLENALQQLQQSQLHIVQGEKMASLGNLVAGVAHEINNPIGFLKGSIVNAQDYVKDLLEHLALYQRHYPNASEAQDHAEEIDLEFLTEDLPKLLESMQGATDRIRSISTSLRTFSRADTEFKVRANLHEGLDSTLLILKYRLKANEFRPEINVIKNYGELPLIDCFPGQLNQVFMNILANAIDMFDEVAKSQPAENASAHFQQITIGTEIVNHHVQVRIEDNGKGMTEEIQARIFDHLFTTKEVGKGTGLGLAIARQIIVERHGGSLEVQSAPGKGTAFHIRLPLLA